MKKRFCLNLLVWFIGLSAYAQNYRYTIYNTENSFLPQTQVRSLLQDHKGNLWIGTKFGVAKYDGKNAKLYNAQNGIVPGDIQYIFETLKGDIFLGTPHNGFSIISGDSIYSYPLEKEYKDAYFTQKGNRIFIVKRTIKNTADIFIFYKSKYIKKAHTNFNNLYIEYANDTLWGLGGIKKQQLFGYFDESLQFHKKNSPFVNFGLYKSKDSIYLSTAKGIYKYQKGVFTQIKGSVNNLHFSNKGIYYNLYYNDNKIYECDYSGASKNHFSLPSCIAIIEDKENNRWFATENGLYKLANTAFKHFVFKEYGIAPNNPQITINNKEFWLSSSDGHLYKFQDNQFVDYTNRLPVEKATFMIGHITKPDGSTIWGIQGGGMNRLKGIIVHKNNTFFTPLNEFLSFYSFYYDTTAHKLLGGYQKGVLIMDDHFRILQNIDTLKGLIYTTGIEKDTAGNYWLSSRRAVYKYSQGQLKHIDIPLLKSGALQIIHDQQHNLWFGGEGGLIFYNNLLFKQIKHNALKNKAITTLYQANDSVLLIGTTAGLATMNLKSFYNEHKIVMKFYDAESGFSGYECMQSGFVEDEKGYVWIALNDRMIQIDPRKLNFRNVPVAPYISGLYVLEEATWVKHDTSKHILYHNDDKIKFEFSGPYFSNPVLYSYKLEGFDKNWSDYDNIQQAIYTNLPPGNYTFKVKAINGEESGQELSVSYSFTKEPAIWETIWFYLFILALLLSLVYFLYKYKINKARKIHAQQLELNKLMMQAQLAQLDPHFIFNTLTSAGTFALRLKEINIYDTLVNLSRLLRMQIKDGKITRTLEEELSFVKQYCELNRQIHNNRFDYFIEIAKNVDTSIMLVKLSIQNFVENAVKHGIENITGKGIIYIEVKQDTVYTTISIEDNGIGYNSAKRKKSKRSKRIGLSTLRNTFDLYNRWNKYPLDFTIKDKSETNKNDRGTIVEIKIPNNFVYEPKY